jgi:hypothetical protein
MQYYETIYKTIILPVVLYGCKTCSLTLREEVTGDWRKLHNEELHNLYSLSNIIRMSKSRRMRWAGHVAGYWWESQKERDHWEDQHVGRWTILKWILER